MIRNASIVVLALAALGAAIAWAASEWCFIQTRVLIGDSRGLILTCSQGIVDLAHFRRDPDYIKQWRDVFGSSSTVPEPEMELYTLLRRRAAITKQCSPFTCSSFSVTPDRYMHFLCHYVRCPIWPLSAVCAAYPIVALIRGPLHRWRRGRKGLCIKCGYDLTGNVTGVCPECGEAL